MAKSKPKNNSAGLVYSTNPEYLNQFGDERPVVDTPPKDKQKLRVMLDKKQRAGKVVTLVSGFAGKEEDLQTLGKELKTKCGAGGSTKDGDILIQGDYRDKVLTWLKDWGYTSVR